MGDDKASSEKNISCKGTSFFLDLNDVTEDEAIKEKRKIAESRNKKKTSTSLFIPMFEKKEKLSKHKKQLSSSMKSFKSDDLQRTFTKEDFEKFQHDVAAVYKNPDNKNNSKVFCLEKSRVIQADGKSSRPTSVKNNNSPRKANQKRNKQHNNKTVLKTKSSVTSTDVLQRFEQAHEEMEKFIEVNQLMEKCSTQDQNKNSIKEQTNPKKLPAWASEQSVHSLKPFQPPSSTCNDQSTLTEEHEVKIVELYATNTFKPPEEPHPLNVFPPISSAGKCRATSASSQKKLKAFEKKNSMTKNTIKNNEVKKPKTIKKKTSKTTAKKMKKKKTPNNKSTQENDITTLLDDKPEIQGNVNNTDCIEKKQSSVAPVAKETLDKPPYLSNEASSNSDNESLYDFYKEVFLQSDKASSLAEETLSLTIKHEDLHSENLKVKENNDAVCPNDFSNVMENDDSHFDHDVSPSAETDITKISELSIETLNKDSKYTKKLEYPLKLNINSLNNDNTNEYSDHNRHFQQIKNNNILSRISEEKTTSTQQTKSLPKCLPLRSRRKTTSLDRSFFKSERQLSSDLQSVDTSLDSTFEEMSHVMFLPQIMRNRSVSSYSLGSEDLSPRPYLRSVLGNASVNSFYSSNSSSTSSRDSSSEIIEWQKGKLIDRGAFGAVYLGLTNKAQLIAVKEVQIGMDKNATKMYKRLQGEIAILKALKHPNIIRFIGTSLEESCVCIFMEYIPGGSIAGLISSFGPLNESIYQRYTKQIIYAVHYLHGQSVVHRDIKGANILVTVKGLVKLIDFGCAKELSLSLGNAVFLRSVKGTPYWMSPEVIQGTGSNHKSDIWSIGCTVVEMAHGKPPWSEYEPYAAMFAIAQDVNSPPLLDPQHSGDARSFVKLCLTRDKTERPSAEDLLTHPFICI